MIGDRMDTRRDRRHRSGMDTILDLSGVTSHTGAERFACRASRIVDSVADLVDELA